MQINGASEDAPPTFVLYLGVYIMNESCVMDDDSVGLFCYGLGIYYEYEIKL